MFMYMQQTTPRSHCLRKDVVTALSSRTMCHHTHAQACTRSSSVFAGSWPTIKRRKCAYATRVSRVQEKVKRLPMDFPQVVVALVGLGVVWGAWAVERSRKRSIHRSWMRLRARLLQRARYFRLYLQQGSTRIAPCRRVQWRRLRRRVVWARVRRLWRLELHTWRKRTCWRATARISRCTWQSLKCVCFLQVFTFWDARRLTNLCALTSRHTLRMGRGSKATRALRMLP
mmetsp:Transcript_65592/g.55687  ORF Transcript_65592/g.55687 Transcript_65592/m.55687 type:complete len:229 (+) Transcript_65592:2598-3284(+)